MGETMFSTFRTTTIGAAALTLAQFASPAQAANYVFSSDATITFDGDGNKETIAGSFTVDTTNSTASNVNIVLTGPSPEAGTYNSVPTLLSGGAVILANNSTNTALIEVGFKLPLTTSPDPIDGNNSGWSDVTGGFFRFSAAATGDALFATASAPEPSAFALLISAFAGLFLFRSRATRRNRRFHAGQPEIL